MKPKVAVAAVSQDAARAGARSADRGGNAVDAALAAGLTAAVTHPGMCSLGGAVFVTVWPPDEEPAVVDGAAETPGRGLPPDERGGGAVEVHVPFGAGVETEVGPGSVAVPGLPAGCSLAARRFGRLGWRELLEPVVDRVRGGFPLPPSCHAFLAHAHEPIYARDDRSRAALTGEDGTLLEPGGIVRPEGLAASLETLAREGAEAFYRGGIGRRIADHVRDGGGSLTRRDLREYRPRIRRPLQVEIDGWRVATNPSPATGGRRLAALLALSGSRPREGWGPDDIAWLVRAQRAVLGHGGAGPGELPERVRSILDGGVRPGGPGSPATLHTSAVDGEGRVCSITMSDGYGSGVMPPGTGLWLNNCLGERELNPGGPGSRPPGRRVPSNMAPTAARSGAGAALAVGTPGSERIPTVLHQVLLHRIRLGASPEEAVRRPRLHVEASGGGPRVACEPGLPTGEVELPLRRCEELDLYFGGAAVAERGPDGDLLLAADPRRGGGTAVGGGGGRSG